MITTPLHSLVSYRQEGLGSRCFLCVNLFDFLLATVFAYRTTHQQSMCLRTLAYTFNSSPTSSSIPRDVTMSLRLPMFQAEKQWV